MTQIENVRSPGRASFVFNALAVVGLCLLIAAYALVDRREVLKGAYEEVNNLSDALAEHTRQTLVALDLGLITLSREVASQGGLETLSSQTLYELLLERQVASATTYAFYALDSQGRLIGSSGSALIPDRSFADASHFLFHLSNPDSGLLVSPPQQDPLNDGSQRWGVTISKRIDAPDGKFGGMLAAVLSVEQLLSFYDTLRVGEHGVVALVQTDGRLVARSPSQPEQPGKLLFEPDQLARLVQGGEGYFVTRFADDDVERIVGYDRVGDRDVMVLVGFSTDEVLAPWRERLLYLSLITAAVIALFMLAGALFARQLARSRSWEEERIRRLSCLAEASTELARARDEDELRVRVTHLARTQVGALHAVSSVIRPDAPGGYVHSYAPDEHGAPAALVSAQSFEEAMRRGTQAFVLPPAESSAGECLVAPVVGQLGVPLAVMRLLARPGRKFSEVDLAEITQLANFTAVALENLRAVQHREAAALKLETVFSSISDGVAAVDAEWRFTYLNAEAERLLQRSRDELLGQNMWDAFPESTESPAFPVYRQAREENRPVTAEFYFPPLKRWFSVRAYPYEHGLTIYFQDITQRIEIEQQLRHSQKMDAIGKLTGGVAHDFNNLLTVILGNANAALEWADSANLAPATRRQIDLIRVAGERAAELTHRLLAFARRQPLDPVPTDVNRLLSEFDELLRRTLGHGIKIQLRLPDDVWQAVVDPHELQNAILNLAINARDAMPDGGVLGIASANVTITGQNATLFDLPAGDYVVVEVSDTGEGMPPEVVSRAFEPFFTAKPSGKGSGLGLSMVYGFAKQSGGQVQIVSSPGAGSTLRIYLPRAADSAAGSAPHAAVVDSPRIQAHLAGRGQHVLLVDDDDLVRIHTDACLQQLGYTVTACADGAQAMEYLDNGGTCDVLVTDVRLRDGASGPEVAESARMRCPRIKVLYVSGYTENAFLHDERVEVDICLLGKPFRTEELARKLRELLSN